MHDVSDSRSARAPTRHETREQRGQLGALSGRETVERLLDRRAAFAAALIQHGPTVVGEGDDAAASIRGVGRSRDETAIDAIGDDAACARLIDADRSGERTDARTITEAIKRRQQAVTRHVRERMFVPTTLPPEGAAVPRA